MAGRSFSIGWVADRLISLRLPRYRLISMDMHLAVGHAATFIILSAALCILPLVRPAAAQMPHPIDPDQSISEIVRAAYAAPYGRALVADFAAIVHDSAQPACLQSKGFDDSKLIDRGQDML